jgi:hypothetical protein
MAFVATALRRVTQGAPTIWTYDALADANATLDTSGYFSAAADKLKVKDIIMVTNTTPPGGIFVVSSNTRDLTANPPVFGVVDINDALSLGSTDTD